jgi:hypothetical protein
MMKGVLIGVAGLAMATGASWAVAFTLSDGTHVTCMARGAAVREYEAPADDPILRDRTGIALPEHNGYVIGWNMAKLKALPPVVRDFLFYHECAHARIPTSVELQANCGGLKDMRAAGRAGPKVEEELGAYFGAGNTYWQDTLKCADRPPNPADPPGMLAPRPPG